MQPIRLDQDHVKSARRLGRNPQQVVLRGKDDAPALGRTNTASSAAKVARYAFAHLHKNQRAITRTHDQVDFATAAPRRSIIALQQAQAPRLQELQGLRLGGIAHMLGGGLGRFGWKDSHVSAQFSLARAAAEAAASGQHYPQGALYVVATPIGNLADISLRALHVLRLVDTIACEDTRHTQSLLRAYGIDAAPARLLAVHEHNESQAASDVLQRLCAGQRVAYVSDAGTPGISDPGARLVAAAQAQGLRTIPLPGASSPIAILSVAGLLDLSGAEGGFVFKGFLPSKSGERARAVQELAQEARAVVLLEAPHRIQALALALAVLGERRITVGRELTKQFEDVATMPARSLPDWLQADANRLRGEFALVLHAAAAAPTAGAGERTLRVLLAHLPLKTAVQLSADLSGESRNRLYEAALALKNADPD